LASLPPHAFSAHDRFTTGRLPRRLDLVDARKNRARSICEIFRHFPWSGHVPRVEPEIHPGRRRLSVADVRVILSARRGRSARRRRTAHRREAQPWRARFRRGIARWLQP
jgi:hypothetical protein